MTKPKLPSDIDIALAAAKTVHEAKENLFLLNQLRAFFFSYRTARSFSRASFSGALTARSMMSTSERINPPSGRKPNLEVMQLIRTVAPSSSFFCFDMPDRQIGGYKDVKFWLRPQFFFVENKKPKIFILQPRATYKGTIEQIALTAAMTKYEYEDITDGLADVFFLDLRKPKGFKKRAIKIHTQETLPEVSRSQVDEMLAILSEAYLELLADGVEFETPVRKKPTPPAPTLI